MQVKYLLNLSSNHEVDNTKLGYDYRTTVFKHNLPCSTYKDEVALKEVCKEKLKKIQGFRDGSNKVIDRDEPVYVIYSGLAIVMLAFVNELVISGYRVKVLFADKDKGGYYKMEVEF